MSKKDDTFASLIGSLLAAAFLAIPCAMLLLFYPVRRPLAKLFDLEARSMNWTTLRWILLPLKGGAIPGFAYCTWQVIVIYRSTEFLHEEAIALAVPYIGGALLCAFLFSLTHWIQDCYHSPAVQKRIAGMQAERFVQHLIDKNLDRYPDSQALHGALFVFNRGLSNEFSVEADHILVTQNCIYLIETKYRSGTIAANADATYWKVCSPQGETRMRNALRQAKNSAAVLKRECQLPCKVIPLVAILGNDVKIAEAPANVVPAEEILKVIDAFEFGQAAELRPGCITASLKQHVFTDKESVANHISRANLAKSRLEMRDIVTTSSID